MWCNACQQDVPAVGAAIDSSQVVCAYCRAPLSPADVATAVAEQPGTNDEQNAWTVGNWSDLVDRPRDAQDTATGQAGSSPKANEGQQNDGAGYSWADWEAKLEDLDKLLWESEALNLECQSHKPQRLEETPLGTTVDAHTRPPIGALGPSSEGPTPSRAHRWCWPLIGLGMTVFSCGGAMSVWAVWEGVDALWAIGLPLFLLGQTLLLSAVILQTEVVGAQQRQTTQYMAQLRQELQRVEQATTMLAGSHSPAAQSFYMHLAQRASPHILLADLKNQLDLLTLRLANQE